MSAQVQKLSRFVEFGKKIIAVGRNYREHAAELGNPVPKVPLLFMKPTTSYITQGHAIQIPRGCSELHHEVELGVIISQRGSDIPEDRALEFVGGYALALDMTARDFQNEAKKKGHPWIMAKGFDTSCPISDYIPKETFLNPESVQLWLKVNGEQRQNGNTKDMIFTIPRLISYISEYFTLEPGDLILTGTPSGVGPVKEGDTIEAGIDDFITISFTVSRKL